MEKFRQESIRRAVDKEVVAHVHQYIACFWYQVGLPSNLITMNSFKNMVEAIGAYGKNMRIPSYHDI